MYYIKNKVVLFALSHLQCTMNRWASLVKNLGRTSQILERLLYSFSLIPNTLHFVATWSHSPSLRISATIPIVDIGVILGSAISHKLYLKIQLQHTICIRAIQISLMLVRNENTVIMQTYLQNLRNNVLDCITPVMKIFIFLEYYQWYSVQRHIHINDNMRIDYHIVCGTNTKPKTEFEHNAEFGFAHWPRYQSCKILQKTFVNM